MNNNILKSDIQSFISKSETVDIASILFKKTLFVEVTNRELVAQLEARRKCRKKLPTWYNSPNIYYPSKLQIEQTSSEVTAAYKTNLVSGKCLVDLTGGFGVDSYFFSRKIEQVFHCEIAEELSRIASHNFGVLKRKNITQIPKDGISFLTSQNLSVDWVYIDPSRRNEIKGKVFQLADCSPHIGKNLDLIFEKSNNLLIKTSPLLDISMGISELGQVAEIHIVAVDNEVKELLWVLKKGFNGQTEIKTINIQKKSLQQFNFTRSKEKTAVSKFSEPLTYLYEPNAALMKSGAFRIIGERLKLSKLHTNTHLYTSNKAIEFPGRRFKIIASYPFNLRILKKLRLQKANITTRNFPHSVAYLRKKLKIEEGGEIFLFFLINKDDDLVMVQCKKF